ncbi:MAG: hydroxypyruvate isomerase family protein [Chloroflexota bacterium]
MQDGMAGRIRSSLAWWCLEQAGLAPPEIIRLAAAAGYDGIELAEPEWWPAIAGAGLAVAAHRGHASLEVGLNRRGEHDRIEDELLANIDLAARWGFPTLICFSGNRDGLSDEAGLEATAEGLRRVAPAAERAGVSLAVELLNSRVDHPGYQCDRTPWGVRLLDLVGSPAVSLLYDVYHMQIMEGDVIRTIRGNARAFSHYHVAGNPGRNEPDASQELQYGPIYRAISGTGFSGWVGMEFVPTGDPLASFRAAREALASAVAG